MNNTEKKRAESMITSWAARERCNGPAKPVVTVPAKDTKAFKEAMDVLRQLNKTYVFGSYYMNNALSDENLTLKIREDKSPAYLQWEKDNQKFADDLDAKVARLTAEVWDNKHTFESLSKELN